MPEPPPLPGGDKPISSYSPIGVPMASDQGSSATRRALRLALAGLLGGAAVGGTITGVSGLRKLMQQPTPPTIPHELEMEVPVPEKQAAGEDVTAFTAPWWKSHNAQSPLDVWWTVPATAAGVGAGTLGMSALMEHMIKKKRKGMLDQRYQEAQSSLQNAMLNQYAHKESSADPLDTLFDKVEKRGALTWETGHNAKEWIPLATGTGITAAGLLAAIAARGAYKSQEGTTNEDLLNKALQHRSYLESLRSPPPVVFTPKPVHAEEQQ